MGPIRYIRKPGGMPDASHALLTGRAQAQGPAIGPNSASVTHPVQAPAPLPVMPVAPPQAMPALPGAPAQAAGHDLIPWLLMALLHGPEHLKEGTKQTGIPSPEKNKFYTKRELAPKINLPGTTATSYAKAPKTGKSAGPSSDSAALPSTNQDLDKGSPLPKSQEKEAVANPPVTSPDAEPVSRAVDYAGREDSSAVNRSADTKALAHNKATALVDPKIRTYQAKQVSRYALKRPRG